MSDLRRTPLYEEHLAAGAKMVPFAGFEMPIQYRGGITAEHSAVRNAAGLFDVSHMGEFEVTGPQALDLVNFVTTNDASALDVGQAQYSSLPNEDGKLLDDLLVYRMDDRYLLVVNAANRDKDRAWIGRYVDRFDAEVTDRSDETALIAIQGPKAAQILARVTAGDLERIGYYRFDADEVAGRKALVSRTGYTGEDGFELYLPSDDAVAVWRALLDAGQDDLLIPAGLAARDSLRLEMGYALYGNDLDETRGPIEAGLAWVTKLDKGDFVGRDAIRRQREQGVTERLIGFRLNQRGFPRPGYELATDGKKIGQVTSGTVSPTLGVGIGMGYVVADHAKPGTPVQVLVRGQAVDAEVVRPPFYTEGSIRR